MIPAVDIKEIESMLSKKYDYDERKIVGIMLARYNTSIAKSLINECYDYWDVNAGKAFDVFWCGYGKYMYLSQEESDESSIMPLDKIICKNGDFFDLVSFTKSKTKLNQYLRKPYQDHIELVLINYYNGRLHYDELFQIDLEKYSNGNFTIIRELMEWITSQCSSVHDVRKIEKQFQRWHFVNTLHDITLLDWIKEILPMVKG